MTLLNKDSHYLILTHSSKGHYNYYIDILKKEIKNIDVLELNNVSRSIKTVVKNRDKNFIVLNGDILLKNQFYLFLICLLFRIKCSLIFYNVDFLYKKNLRTFFIKLYFKITKNLFRNIRNITLVQNELNEKYGLIFSTDPIDGYALSAYVGKEEMPFGNYLLLFGNHSVRKGTLKFLEAYSGDLNVVVVGRIHDKRILERFSNKENIFLINDFVEDQKKSNLFDQACAVVVPYENWYGSSGVLGHAILHEKIVFGYKGYQMGSIIKKYTRGFFLNNGSIEINMMDIVNAAKINSNNEEILNEYYSVKVFINTIIKGN